MRTTPCLTVAVIGAGIVGLTAALEILRAGHEVLIIEPAEPGGRQAASYGNGAWLSPGSVMPMSVPGLWRKVPGYLSDPTGPFTIRWQHLPRMAPWLLRFILAGRDWARVEACAAQRFPLCKDTVNAHAALAEEAGVPELIRRAGLMYVYRNRSEFLAEEREWTLRSRFGVAFREVEEPELRALEPHLGPEYRFGALLEEAAQVTDPGAYCRALADLAHRRGARRVTAAATGFRREGQRLTAVTTTSGEIACDRAVICAGAWSGPLARAAGDSVPLVSERGYHVVIPDPGIELGRGLMPSDGKMAVVSTPQGIRLAGQVELADLDAAPDWRRVDVLLSFARDMLPALAGRIGQAQIDRWMGHRPSTPDGLPCVGPASQCADIISCFGHAHTGLIQAPATAAMVAAMIDGRSPGIDPRPFSPRRFRS